MFFLNHIICMYIKPATRDFHLLFILAPPAPYSPATYLSILLHLPQYFI